MKKALLIGVLLVMIAAVFAVDVTEDTIVLNGTSGDTLSGSFEVTNDGTESVYVAISDNHAFDVAFTPSDNISVAENGGSETVDIDVDVPADQLVGTYSGTITADPTAGSADTVTLTVNVESNGLGLSYADGTISETIDAGDEVNGNFVVDNARNAAIEVEFSNDFEDGITITASPSTMAALGETEVTYLISVAEGTAPGTYNGNLILTYDEDNKTVNVPFSVTVGSTASVSLSPTSFTYNMDMAQSETKTLTVTNDGNVDLEGLTLTVDDPTQFKDASNNALTFTIGLTEGFDLTVGDSQNVNVQAAVPSGMEPGTYTGDLLVKDNVNLVSETVPVTVNVEEILSIADIDLSEDEVKPNEEIEIDIEIENTAENIDLEDVVVTVEFKDGSSTLEDNDGDDIEFEEEIGDLDAGDDDSVTFVLTIPYDVEDGDVYDVCITVEAEDADSTRDYEIEDCSASFEIVKENYETMIDRAQLQQSSLSCDRFTFLDVRVKNIGDKDDDIVLRVRNSELDIDYQRFFELDSDPDDDDNEYSESFPIDLDDDVDSGTYRIEVRAEYDDQDETTYEFVTLTVQDCRDDATTTTMPITTTSVPLVSTTTLPYTPTTSEGGATFTGSTGYIVLLIVLVVLLAIIVIWMIVKLAAGTKK